jgi:Phosphotransferase enzyme family
MPDWNDPRWLADAHAWIRERADVTGPIEQPHLVPWSTVLRAPTPAGPVWFKANNPKMAHEARVTALLAEKRPDAVPTLLAADFERGWMLMADGGERLRETVARDRDLSVWLDVLPLYAGLQIELAPYAGELLAMGVPDRRLAVLPEQAAAYEELRDHLPQIEEHAARLAAVGIPETIQHDDLHDGQVFVRDGRPLIFDWGDAVVSHPFLSMSVTLEGVIAWGVDDVADSEPLGPYRDAYLRPFERYAPREELERALDDALRLGWVARVLASDPELETAAAREGRIKMFLQEPVE